ncbi:phage terminase small subunit [Streptomyces sp. NBC_01429]|uniref:phage terminase small subunit n=1 Tax=Streptomyces sp. NBC_01429 TaxID=2903862 RepID=UPI002E2C4C9F|nr:hypothetical protein [Streptomyces sp. NBC_01429]
MVSPGPRQDASKRYSRAHRGNRASAASAVVLPLSGCDLPAPDLPSGVAWSEHERAMWAELWESPQATQWSDAFVPLVATYVRVVYSNLTGRATAGLTQEARHISEALGLSPAGLRTLGWTLETVDADMGEVYEADVSDISERYARLTA